MVVSNEAIHAVSQRPAAGLQNQRIGRKLTVNYSGGGHRFLRYSCTRGHLDSGEPKCSSFGGIPVDSRVGVEVLRVVQPTAIEASVQASQDIASQHPAVPVADQQELGFSGT